MPLAIRIPREPGIALGQGMLLHRLQVRPYGDSGYFCMLEDDRSAVTNVTMGVKEFFSDRCAAADAEGFFMDGVDLGKSRVDGTVLDL